MFEISPQAQEHWYLLPNITCSVIVLHQYLRRILYNVFLFPLPYYFIVFFFKKKLKSLLFKDKQGILHKQNISEHFFFTWNYTAENKVVLTHWEHRLCDTQVVWVWESRRRGGHKMTARQKQQNPLIHSPLIHTSCMERLSNFFCLDTSMFFTQNILHAYEPHPSNPTRIVNWQVEQRSTIQITQIYNLQKCKS